MQILKANTSSSTVNTEIRPCPYDEGAFFVKEPNGQISTWVIGSRYRLIKVLGQGGFSCVVLAEDLTSGEQVALKRVGDMMSSSENAKRVLREVCIMRRLTHPSIISLRDVFVRPSQTGKCFYRGGKLVAASLDLYIAMEYMNQGDLFSMRGQLSEGEVHIIMWQLLTALNYLHSNNVWHRDVKSSNILAAFVDGRRIVKVADFGSARSAETTHMRPDPSNRNIGGRGPAYRPWESFTSQRATAEPEPGPMHHASDSSMGEDQQGGEGLARQLTLEDDLYVKPSGGVQGGFRAPLTRTVCTPCYRAPEVVMSRGVYSSAMDMWSLGCIFGELLQRVTHIGKASIPNLKVAPVFALKTDGMLKTPGEGEHYALGPGSPTTRHELEMIFDVIGTPPWASIDAVAMSEWRRYLRKIPARAPQLWRRFGAAGEVAIDLLSRLLSFDPHTRCCAEEAMSHEYFSDLEYEEPGWFWQGMGHPVSRRTFMDVLAVSRSDQRTELRQHMTASQPDSTQILDVSSIKRPHGTARFYEITDPSLALAALENELAAAVGSDNDVCDTLREMLERECAMHAAQEQQQTLARQGRPASLPKEPRGPRQQSPSAGEWPHFTPDTGIAEDPAIIAHERIPYHADSEMAKLDAEEHLRPNRHGEWGGAYAGGPGIPAGPQWGVTLTPAGVDESTACPQMMAAIRRQHAR